MTPVTKTRLADLIAACFIFLFTYTVINKLLDLRSFQSVLAQSPFIGRHALFFSFLLPVTELLAVGLLFLPVTRRTGLLLSLLLMTGFTVYISFMLLTQSTLPCSCGGVLKKMTWPQHLWFNMLFTLLAAAGLFLYRSGRRMTMKYPTG